MTDSPKQSAPLPTILADEDGLIVVDKPAGWPSTGRTLEDPGCIQAALMAHYRRMVWAIHQLDRGTSGINLFARKKSLVGPWSEHLQKGQKTYRTWVYGAFAEPTTIDAPLDWSETLRRRAVVPTGKPARSHVTPVRHTDEFSEVLVRIETGRTHQVRLHLAHLGHPLIGEDRYREPPCPLHPLPALHAEQLEVDGRRWVSPLPQSLVDLRQRLGLTP